MIKSNLKVLLAQKEIKGKELAEKIGVDEAKISNLITNKYKLLNKDVLERICEALDCDVSDLFYYDRRKKEATVVS